MDTVGKPAVFLLYAKMKHKAFTLVELLVVIAIIGLLSSVAVTATSNSRDKARIAAGQSFERSVLNSAGSDILAQWDFEDCTGTGIAATTINDISGNNNNANPIASPQWSSVTPTGKGCSLGLNGTSQYALGSRALTELASSSFTVSLWAKRTTPNIIGIAFSSGSVAANTYLHIGFRGGNTFTCAFYGNDLDTTATYTDTNWHLWTCTYDRATNLRNIYRDGALVASDTPTSAFIGSGAAEIGHYASYFFGGNLDNVRVYAKALTAQSVEKLYAEDIVKHPERLVAR